MAERRQLRTSEGLEGRSECPATGHGQPDPRWTSVFPSQKQHPAAAHSIERLLARAAHREGLVIIKPDVSQKHPLSHG